MEMESENSRLDGLKQVLEAFNRHDLDAIMSHFADDCVFESPRGDDLFRNGIVDHSLKELCRVYVSHSVKCEYCGNQRSERSRSEGLQEGKYDELLNFESSEAYTDREKAALAYAEAIVWTGDADDDLWERLYAHFSEPELVELGCFIGLTLGQQSWLRLLNIDHHQVMPGTSASMAPGFETADALAESKASERYWARA